MTATDEARVEAERHFSYTKGYSTNVFQRRAFIAGAEWQASHDAAKVEHLRDIITRAHHESMATDLRSATVLAVVRDILAEGVSD